MDPKALLTIGSITGAHGLGGNLKVRSFAESTDTFTPGKQVWLKPGKPAEKKQVQSLSEPPSSRLEAKNVMGNALTILKSSVRKNGLLLTLEGVNNRNLAEELIGFDIQIHRDELPELEEDTWYWEDLYGLKVMDETRGYVGIIEQIFPTGASDILEVRHPDTGQETLIPMHRQFVESVDIQGGIVRTCLPEGL